MKKNIRRGAVGVALVAAAGLAGCAAMQGGGQEGDAQKAAVALMQRDFKSHGQATLERLKQDDVQAACTRASEEGKLSREEAERIEHAQEASIRYPADGRFLGDWKAGEKIAQTGVGKQWSDDPRKPGGGNCYACHQLSPQELSYGTIGPSLLHYGKMRGNSPEMQKYTYGKIYNAEAFSACTTMPRFGYHGILTESQIEDVVALLLDPHSPVNQ